MRLRVSLLSGKIVICEQTIPCSLLVLAALVSKIGLFNLLRLLFSGRVDGRWIVKDPSGSITRLEFVD